MSSRPAPIRQDSPWFRLVRSLVLLLVARLDRRIAAMLVALDALDQDDPRYDWLNEICYRHEDVRDYFLAWLANPTRDLLQRPSRVRVVLPRRRLVRRRAGRCARRAMRPRVAAHGGRGRCTSGMAARLAPASP